MLSQLRIIYRNFVSFVKVICIEQMCQQSKTQIRWNSMSIDIPDLLKVNLYMKTSVASQTSTICVDALDYATFNFCTSKHVANSIFLFLCPNDCLVIKRRLPSGMSCLRTCLSWDYSPGSPCRRWWGAGGRCPRPRPPHPRWWPLVIFNIHSFKATIKPWWLTLTSGDIILYWFNIKWVCS